MPILIIGYGDRSFEVFRDLLVKNAVAYVIDVRSSPRSNFSTAFNRDRLAGLLAAAEIKYVYMGDELGGRPED